MSLINDPLDPDGAGADGVTVAPPLFKTADVAREDVNNIVNPPQANRGPVSGIAPPPPASAPAAQVGAGYSAEFMKRFSGGGSAADTEYASSFMASRFGAPTPAAPAPVAQEQGNFSRGLSVSAKQLKQTAYGTAALIGDTIGADSVKEWGLKGYQDAEKEVKAISKETDSFSHAWEKGGLGEWMTYSSGYLVGQMGELGAMSIAGGVLGTLAAPGAGSAAGAVAGAIEKGAAQAGIKALVGKLIDKEAASLVAKGVSEQVAAQSAIKSVYGKMGAMTANTFLNATQELGSIYGDAVEEAATSGKEYSLGKIWLSGIAATAVDSWADSVGVNKFMNALGGKDGVKGFALEALKGGFREGMTEGVQTVIERWGANKSLDSAEAFRDYIDSAAVGVLGGTASGGTSGALHNYTAKGEKKTDKPDTSLTGEEQADKNAPGGEVDGSTVDLVRPPMPAAEVKNTMNNHAYVAALYSTADEDGRKIIDAAIDRAGTRDGFNAAMADPAQIEKGNKIIEDYPNNGESFLAALEHYLKKPAKTVAGKLNKAAINATAATPAAEIPAAPVTPTAVTPPAAANTAPPAAPVTPVAATTPVVTETAPAPVKPAEAPVAPVAAKPEPVKKESDTTRDNLFDALAHAGQVIAETSPGNKFAVAPQYTTKDLLPAIVKVMDALVKHGYVSFKEMSVEIMRRLRESKTYGHLADSVTPNMLRKAYNGLNTFEGKHDAQKVGAVTPEELHAIITKKADAKPEVLAEPKPRHHLIGGLVKDAQYAEGDQVYLHPEVTGSSLSPEHLAEAEKAVKAKAKVKLIDTTVNKGERQLAEHLTKKGLEFEDLSKTKENDGFKDAKAKIAKGIEPGTKNDPLKDKPEVDREDPASKKYAVAPNPERAPADKIAASAAPLTERDGKALGGATDADAEVKFTDEDYVEPMGPYNTTWKNEKGLIGAEKKPEPQRLTKEVRRAISEKKLTNPKVAAMSDAEFDRLQHRLELAYGKNDISSTEREEREHVERQNTNQELDLAIDSPAIPERIKAFKKKIDSIVGMAYTVETYKSVLRKLHSQVEFIAEAIKDPSPENMARASTFASTDTYDQTQRNDDMSLALDGGIDGVVPVTDSNVAKLTMIRAQLLQDISEMQMDSTAGTAALFMRSLKELDYMLSAARTEAVQGGMTMAETEEIYKPARQSIVDMANFKREQREEETRQKDAEAEDKVDSALADAIQGDLFEREKIVHALVKDLQSNKLTPEQAVSQASTAMRDGDIRFADLVAGFHSLGFDIPNQMASTLSQLSVKSRMVDYVGANGHKLVFRNNWLMSMDKVVQRDPSILDGDVYSDAEKAAYKFWNTPVTQWRDTVDSLALRNKSDPVMQTSDNIKNAFRDSLFMRYTLDQMRDPARLPAEDRMVLLGTLGDLTNAWYSDVAQAARTRPDLAPLLLNDGGILDQNEVDGFRQWYYRQRDAIATETRMAAKIPYFAQLRNLDGLFPNDKEAELKQRPMDGNSPKSAETPYERFYVQIANAEIHQLDAIMADAVALHKALKGLNPLTNMYADAIADHLDDVAAREETVGQTIEDFAEEQRRPGKVWGEGSMNELANEDGEVPDMIGQDQSEFVESLAYNGGFEDIDQELEDMANEVSMDVRYGDSDSDGNPQELRFRKGAYSGVVPAATIQTFVEKLVSTWKSAPHITVLQNASQLPAALRKAVMGKLGNTLGAKGLYHDGSVYLFSDHIVDEADAEFTVFHETYGHLGMRAFLGDKFDSFLETAYRTNTQIRALVDEMMKDGKTGKLEAIDEVLAEMAAMNKTPGVVRTWVGKMVAGLRNMGMTRVADWISSLDDAEIAYTLSKAREAAQNGDMRTMDGSPSEVRLATARLPYELFAIKDGKTGGFMRYNPATDTWTAYRANGDDIRVGGYTQMAFPDYAQALHYIHAKGKIEQRSRSGLYVYNKTPNSLVTIPKFSDVKGMKALYRWATTRFQNEYHPVFEVADHLEKMGRLNSGSDVKQALMLYERRTGALVEELRRAYVEPIMAYVKEAAALGADENIINTYLGARHAEERNRAVAFINQAMPDGGSGYKTQDAKDFLDLIRHDPAFRVLEEIGRLTDQMSSYKTAYLVRTGMITRTAAKGMDKYKHYVNLSGVVGVEEEFDDPGAIAGGSKYNVKGAEKRALGRGAGNEAPDILGRTIAAMEAALIRGQKNQVAQRILAMMEQNYDPNFVVINENAFVSKLVPLPIPSILSKVEKVPDENYMARPDVMVAKVNGIPTTMRFKDNGKMSFAEAIHGHVSPPSSTPIMNALGWMNQQIGQMLTTRNPAWIAVNFIRDAQTMFFNASADGRVTSAQSRQMLKNMGAAMKVAAYMSFPNPPNWNVDPAMVMAYNEMKREGGMTSFVNRHSLENQVENLHAAVHGKTLPQKFDGWMNFLEKFTMPMEIAPRLAAYKTLTDSGWSKANAAVFSGEITVNFNMRGSMKEMRQLYLFFNPALQGTQKIYSLAKNNPKRFAVIAGGFAMLGAMSILAARALGGAAGDDDKDPLDKVPTYKRATSIVIAADVPGAAIPIPYGWNAFYALGHFGVDAVLGKQTAGETALRIGKAATEAFSPMGTSGLDSKNLSTMIAKGISPTSMLPAVEWIANENRFGAPIRKEQSPFSPAQSPNSQMAFRTVSPISSGLTNALNNITGGNRLRSGVVDINPAAIDFLIGSVLPGGVTEGYKMASTGVRMARGEDTKGMPLPLIDRFTAKTPEGYDAGAFRRAAEITETAWAEVQKSPATRQEILAEYPNLGMAHALVASATQQIREIKHNASLIENSANFSDAEKVERSNFYRKREKEIYQRVVGRLMKSGDAYKNALMASD